MPPPWVVVSRGSVNLHHETARPLGMGQASTRVPDAINDALQDAADELGVFRSDVIRAALVHYIRANPADLDAFSGGIPTRRTTGSDVYDPTRDA